MEQTVIKIKCPYCGAVLSVRPQQGMENKNVTCPVCKEKSPFRNFRKIVAAASTPVSKKEEACTSYRAPEEMQNTVEQIPGHLNVITPMVQTYQLKLGRNVVGRRAAASAADLQIATTGKLMSREHLVVEVKKIPGKGYMHYASLFKELVNATYVNDERLEYGDCIILHSGDIIKLPDCNIKFEMSGV